MNCKLTHYSIRLLVTLSLVSTSAAAYAAKQINESVRISKDQTVRIELKFANEITIIPTNGRTVEIKGQVEVNDGASDDAYTIKIRESDNQLIIESDLHEKKMHYRQIRNLDEEGNVSSTSQTIDIQARFEVSVPKGHKLEVKTINATVNLQDQEAPIVAESINGEIDLSLSPAANIDVDLRTIHGECYTDLDFKFLSDRKRFLQVGGTKASVRLNKGGTPIRLKTINGHMFLRSL